MVPNEERRNEENTKGEHQTMTIFQFVTNQKNVSQLEKRLDGMDRRGTFLYTSRPGKVNPENAVVEVKTETKTNEFERAMRDWQYKGEIVNLKKDGEKIQ
jgi:hypothetical protein